MIFADVKHEGSLPC